MVWSRLFILLILSIASSGYDTKYLTHVASMSVYFIGDPKAHVGSTVALII